MELLFHKCKVAHSKRVFCLPYDIKKKLTFEDLQNGFELYLNNDEISERVEDNSKILYNICILNLFKHQYQ